MPDPALDEEALPGWDLHPPLGGGLSAAPFLSPLPGFSTPDRHLRHQLLHLGPERILPADEEHHPVRSRGNHPRPAPHSRAPVCLGFFCRNSGQGEDAEAHRSLVPRVAVLDKVTDFLFFLGKLLIVGSVGKCCVLEVSPWGIWLPPPVVLSQKLCSSHPSREAASPFPSCPPIPEPCPSLAFPGILAFFFFTQRIKLVQDTAPSLNYYWVPILVSCPLSLG